MLKKLYHIIPALLLSFIVSIGVNAQVNISSKEFHKKREKAENFYSFENYHLALPIYEELAEADSTNSEINYKLGICINIVKSNKSEAIPYFEKAKKDFIDAYYYLAILYHKQKDFDLTINYLMYYKNYSGEKIFTKEETDYRIDQTNTAKEMMQSPENYMVTDIGTNINTAYPEYGPVVSTDETTLYFTSRRPESTGNLKDPYNEYFEDVYQSHLENGKWSQPTNIGSPVNTNSHDACVAISRDGQELYIYRPADELISGHIYLSKNYQDKWLEPKIIEANINSKTGHEPSASLSPDENTIYFSSNREGGYGGKDLYKVTKLPNGEWSPAMNLGPTINTIHDEDAPFMHPDGTTLYFSSTGHRNMGGYDIFKSTINEDNTWTVPENMGYPLNTIADDIYFCVTADSKKGYFSSNRSDSHGSSDIFYIEMPDNYSNYKILKGNTISDDSLQQVRALITLIDEQTKKVQGIYRSTINGKYILLIMPKKKYKLIVEADGYYSYTEDISIPEGCNEQECLIKNIRLEKTK